MPRAMSKKPDVWMPFYIGDYLADTAHLSTEQHGAYLLLLLAAWKRRGTLPADDEQLAAIARLPMDAWARHRRILAEFFTDDGATWTQARLMREYENAARANEAQQENGRKGGRPKKPTETQPKPTGSIRVNPNESPSPSPSQEATSREGYSQTAPSAAGAADRVGVFEGHDHPVTTPNPVAAFAIVLSRAGFQCTSLNPDLVAYVAEGGTVDHLMQCARLPECVGKKATYPIRIARRELADAAAPMVPGNARAGPSRPLSKTAEAFLTLEGMKSENRLAARRDFEGPAEVAGLIAGPDAGE
jgi:uncharacterized protein YdaU (DUF1376 family)